MDPTSGFGSVEQLGRVWRSCFPEEEEQNVESGEDDVSELEGDIPL